MDRMANGNFENNQINMMAVKIIDQVNEALGDDVAPVTLVDIEIARDGQGFTIDSMPWKEWLYAMMMD